MQFIWGECNIGAIHCGVLKLYEVIVVEKCVCISVFKRSAEEDNKLFAVYAGDKILQFNIVNVKEAIASEAVQSSP